MMWFLLNANKGDHLEVRFHSHCQCTLPVVNLTLISFGFVERSRAVGYFFVLLDGHALSVKVMVIPKCMPVFRPNEVV